MIFLTLKKKDTLTAILIQNKMSILAKFIQSNTDWKKCPDPKLPEYALIGRSNVGKSSLINMLTERKSLAKISSTPGKTQLINHFLINNSFFLADLPGYGYAKVSKKSRAKFAEFTLKFLENRKNLMCVFVLIDSRIKPQKIDLEFMEYCGIKQIPFVMCFTKADKLKPRELELNIENYQNEMLKNWESLPETFITSSKNALGKEAIYEFIDQTNALFSN